MSHDAQSLTADVRTTRGKGAARSLRRDNRVPAVLYGGGQDNVMLSVDPKLFGKATDPERGWNSLYTLVVQDKAQPDVTQMVMVADIHLDNVTRNVTHIDFMRVDPDKTVLRKIPVAFSGKSAGVVRGGKLRTFRRTVTVAAKPLDLPVRLDVDITDIDTGQSLRVRDVNLDKVRIVAHPDQRLCTVDEPKARPEDEEAEKDEKDGKKK